MTRSSKLAARTAASIEVLVVSNVVAINVHSGRIVWRLPVDGYRSDHMALSPNGNRLLVSASTARTVDVIDTTRGRIVARIPSGDSPHEINFSPDGRLIYHASIGAVYTSRFCVAATMSGYAAIVSRSTLLAAAIQ